MFEREWVAGACGDFADAYIDGLEERENRLQDGVRRLRVTEPRDELKIGEFRSPIAAGVLATGIPAFQGINKVSAFNSCTPSAPHMCPPTY